MTTEDDASRNGSQHAASTISNELPLCDSTTVKATRPGSAVSGLSPSSAEKSPSKRKRVDSTSVSDHDSPNPSNSSSITQSHQRKKIKLLGSDDGYSQPKLSRPALPGFQNGEWPPAHLQHLMGWHSVVPIPTLLPPPTTGITRKVLLVPLPQQRFTRQTSRPFSLLHGFMKHPELILNLASHLEVRDLVSLYAISKPFHFIMNSHYTTYIRASANRWAPNAAFIFPWRCYRLLTIKDPQHRPNWSNVSRDIPGLRWLQMVAFRQKTVETILGRMYEQAHIFPPAVLDVLKKIWFTMDLPRSAGRIATIHNLGYWSDSDLAIATMFFIKLDMRFSDPVEGSGELALRKLLFGFRSLVPLKQVLCGRFSRLNILRLQVWNDYRPAPHRLGMPIMRMHPLLIGRGCHEGWGRYPPRLLRPDELVMREGIRRGCSLHGHYMDAVLWGHITVEDRRKKKMLEEEKLADATENLRIVEVEEMG